MTDINVTYGDTVYCSVDDVADLFRKDAAFSATSNPSDSTVLNMIRKASDRWDRETRHAWRENTAETEYNSYDTHYRWDAGRPVMLNKLSIRPFDGNKGDKIEVWDGSKWNDWIADASYSEGRNQDYWLDHSTGQLYIYDRFVWRGRPQLRVTYRYGEDPPTATDTVDGGNTTYTYIESPHDITEAVSKLVAIDLMSSDQHTNLVPGGEGAPSPETAMKRWEADVYGKQGRKGIQARHKVDPAWIDSY